MEHLVTNLWCKNCSAWIKGLNKTGKNLELNGYCNRYGIMTGDYEWCETCDPKPPL